MTDQGLTAQWVPAQARSQVCSLPRPDPLPRGRGTPAGLGAAPGRAAAPSRMG